MAIVKKNKYSTYDQLKGKAERRAKKSLYEYLTGMDLGDADPNSAIIDIPHEEVKETEGKNPFENDKKQQKNGSDKAEQS